MILVTHGIVGASIAIGFQSNPVLGVFLAFVSHFVLDMIPHLDYRLKSVENSDNPLLVKIINNHHRYTDFCRVAFDGLLGLSFPLVTIYLLFGDHLYIALAGSAFAILPDFLQFVYFKTHAKLLASYAKFHTKINIRAHLYKRPVLGFVTQFVVALISVVTVALIW